MSVTYTDTYTRGWSPDGEIAFVTLSDGRRLRYLKTGKGPTLVLLHTLRTQLDYLQRLIPKLTDHYTVYALDLPGLGWSDIGSGASYAEPAVREAIVEFVEALDLDDVTLAGESIGATMSLTASTQLGRRVRQVVALNTYDYSEGVERANLLASILVKAMRIPVFGRVVSSMGNVKLLAGIMRGGFFDGSRLPQNFVEEQMRSGGRRGYSAVETGYFRALPSYIAARKLYSRVNVPVTLVYGDHDWSKPGEREETARLLPGSRVITLSRSGHFGSLEHPDEIASILIKLAGSASKSPSTQNRKSTGGAS
jgi:pimeloyl-ACP methyl ester carboxylesterase